MRLLRERSGRGEIPQANLCSKRAHCPPWGRVTHPEAEINDN